MLGIRTLKKSLHSILLKDYVAKDEFSNLVDYLLINQLNAQASLDTGSASNQRLREVFLSLVQSVQPTVFCDIGSRDGESAVKVNHLLPNCECYAFEASPKIYQQFQASLENLNPQVRYLNLAIGDVNQPVKIFAPKTPSKMMVGDEVVDTSFTEPENTGRTSLLRRNEEASYEEFEIPCFTLDHFLTSNHIQPAQHRFVLWVDVEGAADKVLAGAQQVLKQTAMILVEVEGFEFWQQQQKCDSVIQDLIKQGFVPIIRDREYYDKQFNVLLLHQKYLKAVYPALFNLKGDLSSLKVTRDVRTLQEQVKFIENFLDDSIEASLSNSYEEPISNGQQANHLPLAELSHTSSSFVHSHPRCDIPIYIPCFNNYTYLKNTVEQLLMLNCQNLIVVDNASTYPPLVQYLEEIERKITVVYFSENYGPHHLFSDDFLYALLPTYFCVTDPDLEFNCNLPPDFISQLLGLTETFQVGKAGFSLDISHSESMVEEEFSINGQSYKIWEWEARFWQQPIGKDIYKAAVDTTFAVYNKKYFDRSAHTNAVRVAGDFTCRHLPWYKTNQLPLEEEEFYRTTNRYSYYFRGTSS